MTIIIPVNHNINQKLVGNLLTGSWTLWLTASLCTINAAALPLHTPQSFPLKSLNLFCDLYVEWPNHMATVFWNECPYLHCSPVMGVSLLGGVGMKQASSCSRGGRTKEGSSHICANEYLDFSMIWYYIKRWVDNWFSFSSQSAGKNATVT